MIILSQSKKNTNMIKIVFILIVSLDRIEIVIKIYLTNNIFSLDILNVIKIMTEYLGSCLQSVLTYLSNLQ